MKTQCVSWFIQTKSYSARVHEKVCKTSTTRFSVCLWHKIFMYTGSVLDAVKTGRPRLSAKNTNGIRQTLSCSLANSIRTAAREYELPPTRGHKIAHKWL